MSQEPSKIICPNCGEEIDVNEILYHQLNEQLSKKYNDKLAQDREKIRDEKKELEKEKAFLEEKVAESVKQSLKEAEAGLKQKAREEQAEQLKSLQEELKEKTGQVKELNKSKAEVEKLKRANEELKDSVELEIQKKLTEQLAQAKEKIQKIEAERVHLQIKEREAVINQLKEQLQEAQRKVEQGSMQIQGEVLELAIEEWLANQFPLDTIEEIKKGERGADCLQIVNTQHQQNCGSIYYESKRTKSFQPTWIEKFKADIRDRNANIGVLVTEAMPSDMDRLGLKDGIWICSYDEFKGLCTVLRESLVQISQAITSQENKGDKMGMLYDFLTSNEFRLQVEAIVEGFTQMKVDLDKEKRAMQGLWKKREKQIDKVLTNTTEMHSSIRGIAGSAVQPVSQLELPEAIEGDEE